MRGLDAILEEIGGVSDHVRHLIGLKATHCLSDFMRELKKVSSAWIRDELSVRGFNWQEGYAAFTVSATVRDGVRGYIRGQDQHHCTESFRDELIGLLRKANVEYDLRYLD